MVPQALSFARNPAGKPHLQWEGALTTQQRGVPLHFNLSHTATLLGETSFHVTPIGMACLNLHIVTLVLLSVSLWKQDRAEQHTFYHALLSQQDSS